MSTTPEALAAQLDAWAKDYATTDYTDEMATKAAAELRRLAQVEQYAEALNARCIEDTAEIGRLRAEVEALRNALWKACGDDREVVHGYLEAVGFPQVA